MAHRTPPTLLEEVHRDLERLKLHAIAEALHEALEEAQSTQQGYASFLAGLVRKEVLASNMAAIKRRVDTAKFPRCLTFNSFDWSFQPGLNIQLVKDLMTLHFIRQARPVLMLGKPGTGKSHMSIAYGHLAAEAGYTVRYYSAATLLTDLYASLADASTDKLIRRLARVDLLIIDDLRHVPTKTEYASLLYELIEARHGRKATILSSNLSVKEWGKVLGNQILTASMVDRLMEKALVINIKRGRSYRTQGPDAPPEMDRPQGLDPEHAGE